MHSVYILFSVQLDRYYIGQSENLPLRLEQHNSGYFSGSFTSQVNDWELFHEIPCESKRQAIQIESHIKRMKSVIYYENLKKHPDISVRLLEKYQ